MDALFKLLLPIYALILFGYLGGRFFPSLLALNHHLTKLLYWVVLPSQILLQFRTVHWSHVIGGGYVLSFALSSLGVAFVALILGQRHHLHASSRVVSVLSCIHVNSAYLGIPLLSYLQGSAVGVVPVMMLQILILGPAAVSALNVIQKRPVSRLKGRAHYWWFVRTIVSSWRTPLLLSAILGLTLNLTGIKVPALTADLLQMIGTVGMPLALLSLGISISERGAPQDNHESWRLVWENALLKTVVHPLLALYFGLIVGLDEGWLYALVLMSALPTANNVYILSMQYQAGKTIANRVVFLTSILSFIVIAALLLSFDVRAIN